MELFLDSKAILRDWEPKTLDYLKISYEKWRIQAQGTAAYLIEKENEEMSWSFGFRVDAQSTTRNSQSFPLKQQKTQTNPPKPLQMTPPQHVLFLFQFIYY